MVLTADGSKVTEVMNDELTMQADLSQWTEAGENPDGSPNKFERPFCEMMAPGYIGLQDHGGNIWFKDLELTLPYSETRVIRFFLLALFLLPGRLDAEVLARLNFEVPPEHVAEFSSAYDEM